MHIHNPSKPPVANKVQSEAHRQLTICNACRYCEGYCAVFPSIAQQNVMTPAFVDHIAHVCHNCRSCHYACQYSEPHEFAVNLPQALANVRQETWQRLAWPGWLARLLFTRISRVAVVLLIALLVLLVLVDGNTGGAVTPNSGFYAFLSHRAMIALFIPAFVLPLLAVVIALQRYWRDTKGGVVHWQDVLVAVQAVAMLRQLRGGQNKGCHFAEDKAPSKWRWFWHQCVFYGFLLCFASTSSGTILHYVFDMPAPYAWYSVPKLLGVPGGVALTLGCAGLVVFKIKADRTLGAQGAWAVDMAFVVILGLVGLSGLLLYAATGTGFVPHLLVVHLALVLAFFLLTPYSKMMHGFYRFAAQVREAQLERYNQQKTSR